jgi:hypothetical protein
MRMAWHNKLGIVGVLLMLSFLSFQLLSSLLPLINVNTFRPSSTMGIKMCTSNNKDKPPKPTSTIESPQLTCNTSRSPKATNVNSLLAKINLPKS